MDLTRQYALRCVSKTQLIGVVFVRYCACSVLCLFGFVFIQCCVSKTSIWGG